jgi:hypothetical protein
MDADKDAVCGKMQVGFQDVDALIQGPLEGGECVLWTGNTVAAVGHEVGLEAFRQVEDGP